MSTVDNKTSLASIADLPNLIQLGKSGKSKMGEDSGEDKEKEKRELRKKLKTHHKALSEKADKAYEEDNKEMGRKYREMANKLAADMDDENKELSLSDYPIDEAALSSPELSEMAKLSADLKAQIQTMQQELLSHMNTEITAKLSGIAAPKLSAEDQIAKLKIALEQATSILESK